MGDPPTTPLPARPQGLLNVLGLAFGVAVTVGGCIGVGILKAPGVVAEQLPHPALYLAAWVVGGAYVLLGAISVAELAAMTPRSGAFYVFTRRALGEYAGFVTGWAHWLGLCSGAAFIYLTLAGYITGLFPILDETAGRVLPDLEPESRRTALRRGLALFVVVGLAAIHWRSVRRAGRIQELTALVQGVAFFALVLAFFLLGESPAAAEAAPGWSIPTGLALLGGFVIAFQAILQTYDGWEGTIYFGEEVRDPGRNLPRALIVGTLTVIALYCCVNLALLYVLPLGQIAGKEMALATAAEVAFGSGGGKLIFALATVSILVACNAGTLQTPRVLFAMTRDGLFFPAAARVNAGGTPTVALGLTTLAIGSFLIAGTIGELYGILAFFLVANYSLVFVALFVLRWREPHAPRPFRAWGFPWTTGLALAGSLVYLGVAVWGDSTNSRYALALLAGSVPVYALVRLARGAAPTAT